MYSFNLNEEDFYLEFTQNPFGAFIYFLNLQHL